MSRVLTLCFGATSYAIFFGTFLYVIGFLADAWVAKTINSGSRGPHGISIWVNVGLLALFGIQHSVMARPQFKRWWTQYVPPSLERSVFVLLTSLLLLLMVWQWKPLPMYVWRIENSVFSILLYLGSAIGWGIVLWSTFLINHFDLFGLRQTYFYYLGKEYEPVKFVERGLYKHVRHPLMLGFLMAFWCTPLMSQGQLLFAVVCTAYILVALQLEERDLESEHGDAYQLYQARVPMLFPFIGRKGRSSQESSEA